MTQISSRTSQLSRRNGGSYRLAPDARTRRALANLFDRRTLIVLGCLVASMTVASGFLLALNPEPLAPASGVMLTAMPDTKESANSIFALSQPLDEQRWKAIVIHHSGQPRGNAQTIDELHTMLDYGGLGYHFVIGNGQGAPDGHIRSGYRWRDQIPGVHAAGEYAEWYNAHAIAICLIGNGDQTPPTARQKEQLLQLVTALQLRLQIPADRIFLHSEIAPTTSPGRHFDEQALREQLIDLTAMPVANPVAAEYP